MLSALVEGGLVLDRASGTRTVLPAQIMLCRSHVRLLSATASDITK
jgi:hypothetical protein